MSNRVEASNMSRCRMRPTVARQSVARARDVSSYNTVSQATASCGAGRPSSPCRYEELRESMAQREHAVRRAVPEVRTGCLDAAEVVASQFPIPLRGKMSQARARLPSTEFAAFTEVRADCKRLFG
jgi:hypothetical protein